MLEECAGLAQADYSELLAISSERSVPIPYWLDRLCNRRGGAHVLL